MTLGLTPDWHTASLQNIPVLNDQELHVWCLPLKINANQKSIALNMLSDIQRERYHRRHIAGQSSYLAGRYYLLQLLAAYTKQDPAAVKLSYTRLNKPYLSFHEGGITFNFTDTDSAEGPIALFAFCRDREVGVDIEAISRKSNFRAIVKKRFTESEQAFVTDSSGDVIPERFLAIWTRKEASGKATGQGINFKMNSRELLSFDKAGLACSNHNYFDEQGLPWRLSQLNLKSQHIGCVVHASHEPLRLRAFDELLI